ncbi:MAG: CoA-binding protein, partial [Ignisphaera sp.]|nr:CoA-binding protein [Ignisphaera sp.]
MSVSYLGKFFNPQSVAIVGATPKEGKVGRVILENFIKKFKGRIYPINPHYEEIMGLKCYKSVKDVPEVPDLVVVAVPAPGVPQAVREAAEKGVKAAVIISGGFSETGTPEGIRLENELREIVKTYGIRIIGPNGLGVFDNYSGIDTFFLPEERM